MSDSWIPKGYEVPANKSTYFKFQDGPNKFRVLSSPVMGWVYWNENAAGERKPTRKRMNEALVTADIQDMSQVKHFWALTVWNYKDECIQVLEITQKGIQKSLKELAKNEDWGSPKEYDITVTKSGQMLETKYSVMPSKPKELSEEIAAAVKSTKVNLDAIFDNADPFKS